MRNKLHVAAVVLSISAFAQDGPVVSSPLAFEVASIKPCKLSKKGEGAGLLGVTISGDRVTAVINLRYLITYAYAVKDYQIERPEGWIEAPAADAYCISAIVGGNAAPAVDQVRLMFQTLLAERFDVKVHRETQELPVYTLVVDRGGPRFTASPPDGEFSARFTRAREPGYTQLIASTMTMAQFATGISRYTDRPVLNNTGLAGVYDLKMEWAGDLDPSRRSSAAGTSIFTAVREQLGLKLEPQRAPLEILIVDRAKNVPSEN